jgi:hypothetical protein
VPFLNIQCQVKNIGLTKVEVDLEESGVRVYPVDPKGAGSIPMRRMRWIDAQAGSFPVLQEHQWVEPGETARSAVVLALPKDKIAIAYKIEFLVVEASRLMFKRKNWCTEIIVFDSGGDKQEMSSGREKV